MPSGSYLWLEGVGERGMFRSGVLTRDAKDRPCMVRIPGVCNCRRDTTVAAHSNWQSEGKGVGLKAHDWATVYACSACHDELDRHNRLSDDEKRRYWLEAFVRTVGDRIARGVLRVG